MNAQRELFDPATTVPCPIPACPAIRLPGQDKVITCQHDLQPPDDRLYRRPKGCLNAYDPHTADIGF